MPMSENITNDIDRMSSGGDPVEVDFFQAQTSAGEIKMHVFNRAISMVFANDPRIVSLHRFFCVLQEVNEQDMNPK